MNNLSFINHLFKLIWNRKKANFLLIIEIFISFIVLFVVMVIVCYYSSNYVKPLGFEYENVWSLSMDWKNKNSDEISSTLKQIEMQLSTYPEIENSSLSMSYIFSPYVTSSSNYNYNGRTFQSELLAAGDTYPQVLNFDIIKGRWFGPEDNASQVTPIVINSHFAHEVFEQENPIGKTIDKQGEKLLVIGMIKNFRSHGELAGEDNVMFRRMSLNRDADLERIVRGESFNKIFMRVKPGTGIAFEEKLLKNISSLAKGWLLDIEQLDKRRISAIKISLILPGVLLALCIFLLVNVALGLFGVIWQNINKRKKEIGLRRALGATAAKIYLQIIGEVVVITTFAVLIGSFFALQFPLLNIIGFIDNSIFYTAFGFSLLLIYIITATCALYPGILAARIEPATALHNE